MSISSFCVLTNLHHPSTTASAETLLPLWCIEPCKILAPQQKERVGLCLCKICPFCAILSPNRKMLTCWLTGSMVVWPGTAKIIHQKMQAQTVALGPISNQDLVTQALEREQASLHALQAQWLTIHQEAEDYVKEAHQCFVQEQVACFVSHLLFLVNKCPYICKKKAHALHSKPAQLTILPQCGAMF
jgi:hypothetical protein